MSRRIPAARQPVSSAQSWRGRRMSCTSVWTTLARGWSAAASAPSRSLRSTSSWKRSGKIAGWARPNSRQTTMRPGVNTAVSGSATASTIASGAWPTTSVRTAPAQIACAGPSSPPMTAPSSTGSSGRPVSVQANQGLTWPSAPAVGSSSCRARKRSASARAPGLRAAPVWGSRMRSKVVRTRRLGSVWTTSTSATPASSAASAPMPARLTSQINGPTGGWSTRRTPAAVFPTICRRIRSID